MDYCTVEDIETQTSTPTLIQLTSDENNEEVNRVVALEAILYSSTLIDGYLRGRFLQSIFQSIDCIQEECETKCPKLLKITIKMLSLHLKIFKKAQFHFKVRMILLKLRVLVLLNIRQIKTYWINYSESRG